MKDFSEHTLLPQNVGHFLPPTNKMKVTQNVRLKVNYT